MIVFLYLLSVLCLLLYLSISWAAKTLLSLFCLTVRPPAQLITFQPSHPTKPCLPYPLQYCTIQPSYCTKTIPSYYSILSYHPNLSSNPTFPFTKPFLPGLGICSSVFRVIRSFFVSKRAQERFAYEKERIAPIALWKRANERRAMDRSYSLMSIKKEENCQKHSLCTGAQHYEPYSFS